MRLLSRSDDHYLFIYIYISISLSTGKTVVTKNPGCQNDGNEKKKKNEEEKKQNKTLHRIETLHENHDNYQK